MHIVNYAKVLVAVAVAAFSPQGYSEDAKNTEREAMFRKYLDFSSYVEGGRIEPQWMPDGKSFWYLEGSPDDATIWKVGLNGQKEALFDIRRLRNALKNILGHEPPGNGVPFPFFQFDSC